MSIQACSADSHPMIQKETASVIAVFRNCYNKNQISGMLEQSLTQEVIIFVEEYFLLYHKSKTQHTAVKDYCSLHGSSTANLRSSAISGFIAVQLPHAQQKSHPHATGIVFYLLAQDKEASPM